MTTFEAISLIANFSLVLIALLTLVVSIVVHLNKKK
ncbi:putative holin-like toxin [Ammoniphilus oxalaticus]|nr:putative holin-like toxin [Ammoniphilus oxalaticus]